MGDRMGCIRRNALADQNMPVPEILGLGTQLQAFFEAVAALDGGGGEGGGVDGGHVILSVFGMYECGM